MTRIQIFCRTSRPFFFQPRHTGLLDPLADWPHPERAEKSPRSNPSRAALQPRAYSKPFPRVSASVTSAAGTSRFLEDSPLRTRRTSLPVGDARQLPPGCEPILVRSPPQTRKERTAALQEKEPDRPARPRSQAAEFQTRSSEMPPNGMCAHKRLNRACKAATLDVSRPLTRCLLSSKRCSRQRKSCRNRRKTARGEGTNP